MPKSMKKTSGRKIRIQKVVRSVLNANREKKQFSMNSSYTNTVAGVLVAISQGVIQGDAIDQRSGDMITPALLEFNLSLVSGIGSTNSLHRVIVFQDMMNLGVIPSLLELLNLGGFDSTYVPKGQYQQHRFKILYDKVHPVIGASAKAACTYRLKLKPSPIYYNGSTSATASNGKGSIWVYTLADSVAVSTARVSIFAAMHYYDS